MIVIDLYKDDVLQDSGEKYPIYHIEIYDKLNIILGDSGTGKTYMFDRLSAAIDGEDPWSYNCYRNIDKEKIEVHAINSISMLNRILDTENNSIIVIDENTTEHIRKQNMIGKIRKSHNYFILLDRQLVSKFDVNVRAMFKLESYSYNGEREFLNLNHI